MACAGDGRPDRRAKLAGKRVLVAEDEPLVSMLVEDELRGAGAEVVGPVPTVGEALRLIEAAAADGGISAAVLDINLDWRHAGPLADRLAALACRSCSPRATARTATWAGTGRRRCCASRSARKRWPPPSRHWRPPGDATALRMGPFAAEPGFRETTADRCRPCQADRAPAHYDRSPPDGLPFLTTSRRESA